jgi:hypothetical protein
MGWDAFANRTKGHIKSTFRPASEAVKDEAGSVDIGLESGWLDCSACARALEAATGQSCYDEFGWSAKKVRKMADGANWDIEGHDRWALLSAKSFLESCAKINTGINFSW